MKIVIYQCEWCGLQSPPRDRPDGEEWPDGWSNLDEYGNDDLLCASCHSAAHKAVKETIVLTKGVLQRQGKASDE